MNNQQWREWSLQGLHVNLIHFSFTVDIDLMPPFTKIPDALAIRIGSPFTLRKASGEVLTLDPEQPQTLCPLLLLLRCSVTLFRASSEGECQLWFQDETLLSCLPEDMYEAWSSRGSGALESANLLCLPGGGPPW